MGKDENFGIGFLGNRALEQVWYHHSETYIMAIPESRKSFVFSPVIPSSCLPLKGIWQFVECFHVFEEYPKSVIFERAVFF